MNTIQKPLDGVPNVITTGPEAQDCVAQAFALTNINPKLKMMVGSLMLYCQDDKQPERPSYWQRPWMHHVWLVDDEGNVVDPALRNLEAWAQIVECTLPQPIEEMTAIAVPWGEQSEPTLQKLLNGPFNENPEHCLRYMNGCIFTHDNDSCKSDTIYLQQWGTLGYLAGTEGGLSAREFELAIDRVGEFTIQTPPKPTKKSRKSKGFAELMREES